MFRQTIAPGSGPPTHLHSREVEFAYVVSGQFRFRLGERVARLLPGTFVYIPHNTPHALKNVGSTLGVLLFGVTPGGFEKMFVERQGVDAATNKTLMQKHHMQVVGLIAPVKPKGPLWVGSCRSGLEYQVPEADLRELRPIDRVGPLADLR